MKKLLQILLLTSILTNFSFGIERDITIMRTSLFLNVATKVFLVLQDDYHFFNQFKLDFDKLGISYISGREFNDGREISSQNLAFSIGLKDSLYTNKYIDITIENEIILTKWNSKKAISINPNGYIFTLKPMIIYTFKKLKIKEFNLYAEIGSGISYMDNSIAEDRQKSTQFQFSDSLGFGIKSKKYKIGYRFTHISNLDIQTPNPSIDFHQVLFGFRF